MLMTVLVVLRGLGGHRSLLDQSRTRIVLSCIVAPTIGLSLVSLVLFAFNSSEWSRVFLFLFALLAAIVLWAYRVTLRRYFSHRSANGRYASNVVLVGPPGAIRWMSQYFNANVPTTQYRMTGCLVVEADSSGLDENLSLPELGTVADLGNFLVHRPIHEVLVIRPMSGCPWLKQVILDCDYLGVTLRIVPEELLHEDIQEARALYRSGPLHLPMIVLPARHVESESLFVKRVFDIVVSAALLVILAPLFAAIAAAIKLTTPGLTVLYPWRVVGKNGVEFTGYKFTTMGADADQRRDQLAHKNEMSGPVFKIKDDPRVTPVGRFLRKFSLNELPQLWSVLVGDMSLVGPRPAFRHELQRYEFWHKRKLSIMPGITCLWQVRGRNTISSFDDWVKMDLEYIDNWSLWLDVKILFWTARAVCLGTGW